MAAPGPAGAERRGGRALHGAAAHRARARRRRGLARPVAPRAVVAPDRPAATCCGPTSPVRASTAPRCWPPPPRSRTTASGCPASAARRRERPRTGAGRRGPRRAALGPRGRATRHWPRWRRATASSTPSSPSWPTRPCAEADEVDAAVAAGQRSGPAGRRAGGAEGQSLHPGHRHDLRLADPRRVAPALRRHGGGRRCASAGRDRAGQDEHGRVRHGQLDGELGLRADAQPARHRARFRAAAAVVRPPPWRPASRRSAWARTPAAPSASRPPCAGWSG